MDKRSTTIIVGVTAVATVFVLFIFLSSAFLGKEEPSASVAKNAQPVEERASVTLTAKHAFRDGLHTIVGDFELPTPCHILETSAAVSADGRTTVVDYRVSTKTDEGCIQVITPTRYRVQFTAPEDTDISARINGEPAILNLIEAGPNEDLENFELYIKG
jgi:hypothetical protein